MKKNNLKKQNTEIEIGEFGPIYRQFEKKPQEAIRFLCKNKAGDCIHALYREDIGFIDIIWGEVTDPVKHKGYGLAHIIDKHGTEINALGFSLEQFIPILVKYGEMAKSKDPNKIILKGNNFKIIISKKAYKNNVIMNKTFVLTSFSIK